MKKIHKALLFSALGCPGIGQFMYKHYVRGGLMLAAVVIGLGYIIGEVMTQANAIVDKLMVNGQIYDMAEMIRQAQHAVETMDSSGYSIGLAIVVGAWLVSIADLLYFWWSSEREKPNKSQQGENA